MSHEFTQETEKEILKKKLMQTFSAYVEVAVSAYLDGVGTVQNKQPASNYNSSKKKQSKKQAKIEEIRNKVKKRFL